MRRYLKGTIGVNQWGQEIEVIKESLIKNLFTKMEAELEIISHHQWEITPWTGKGKELLPKFRKKALAIREVYPTGTLSIDKAPANPRPRRKGVREILLQSCSLLPSELLSGPPIVQVHHKVIG